MARSPKWLAVLIGSAALLNAACGDGRGDPPPSPTSAFEPAVISLIDTVENDATSHRVVLVDGTTLTLDFYDPSSARLMNGSGQVVPGDLVLAGPGDPPTWWTALSLKYGLVPSGAPSSAEFPDRGCWSMHGGAFDDGDAIHFSNGLRLPKAENFQVAMTYVPNPFPARSSDSFCVDRDGTVTSLDFIWVGGY